MECNKVRSNSYGSSSHFLNLLQRGTNRFLALSYTIFFYTYIVTVVFHKNLLFYGFSE